MHRTRYSCCAAALLLCATGSSFAKQCLSHPSQGATQTISFGEVTVPKDAKPGTVLAERTGSPKYTFLVTCFHPTRTSSLHLFTTPSAFGNGVYDTNVEGIGIRTFFDYYNSGQAVAPEQLYMGWIIKSYVGAAKVQLVVTGPVERGGDLRTGRLATAGFDGHEQAVVDLVDARIAVRRPVCPFLSSASTTSRRNSDAAHAMLKETP